MQIKYPGPGEQPLTFQPSHPVLCGAKAFHTKVNFGEIFFDHFSGDGFDIWFGRYRFNRPGTLCISPEDGAIEFWCHYQREFIVYGEYTGELSGKYKQYQMSQLHQFPRFAAFQAGGDFACFTVRFSPELLEPYAKHCPILYRFLHQTGPLRRASLTDKVCFLTPQMDAIIAAMLQYQLPEGLAKQFYTVKLHEFLVHLVHHLNELTEHSVPPPELLKRAEAAHDVILSDFSVYDTVECLAGKIGINEQALQLSFRYRYGSTVAKFSREQRLQRAFDIISSSNDILLSVALQVGYSDLANFCSAFKRYFGYPPGNLRKRKM